MTTAKRTTLKTWAEEDRPREKLAIKGKNALTNAELLAILLGIGNRRQTAVELAAEILHNCGNDLSRLTKLNQSDLQKFEGVGEAKALTLLACFELGRRRKETETSIPQKINGPQDAYQWFRPYFEDLKHEEFYCLFLNRNNGIIGCEQISVGGTSGTVADGKIIFKRCLDLQASGIILAHNHPSGNLKASEQDLRLTKNLSQFGTCIDIQVLDHLIITDNGYLSLLN